MYQFRMLLLSVLLTSVGAGCGSGERRHQGGDSKVVSVNVAEVRLQSSTSYEEYMGTVIARNRADIESKIQSRIERIPVVLGSRVKKGDLLAELDNREFQARADQARAVFELTRVDLARFETLFQQQAATQQEFDAVKTRKMVAEAALSEAETFLSFTRVVAPFAGTITAKQIDIGDLAVPGKPLFTLEEEGAPRFVVTLPESKLGFLKAGDSLEVSIPVVNETVEGIIEELASSADPISRTFNVRLSLPAVRSIRPGQFGRLLLRTGGDATIFIPRTAWIKRGQLDLVYVAAPDDRARLRLVLIGREFRDKLEILSGLREGERVVISGQRDLSDGDSVEVVL